MPGLCLNAISGLSRGPHRLRYCCPFAFAQSVRNVLLLFCIVTTTSQVHTDFHSAQHPLHRPCVSSQVRRENDGNALAGQLMLPCWVEASLEGYHLYSSCGCEDVEKEYRQTEYRQTES